MRSPPSYGFMEDSKSLIPFPRPENVIANPVSVSHQVPTASDEVSQRASTANSFNQPVTTISQPSSTQNHHIVWKENGNGSDSTSDYLINAAYTQRHQGLKYSTEHNVEYAYNCAVSQPDSVHTPTCFGHSSTAFLSSDTLSPSPRRPSEYSSRVDQALTQARYTHVDDLMCGSSML